MKKYFVLLMSLLMVGVAYAQEFWLEESVVVVKQGLTGQLHVNFADATEDYAGFQFDINLPEGITVEKAAFYENRDYLDEGGSAHVVTINQNGTKCKLMCSAPNNIYQDFESGSDLLITLTLKASSGMPPGTYDGLVDNIKFAKLYDPELGDRFITFDNIPFAVTVEENQMVVLDENSTVPPVAQEGVNVELRRTMYADKWNTFVLPFSMSNAQIKALFGDDTKVVTFQSVTEGTDGSLMLYFVNYNRQLAANTPYLVKPQNGGSSYVIEGVNISPAEAVVTKGVVSFIGTYMAGQSIPEGDYYLSDDTFYCSAGLSTMKAYRAYFHVDSQQDVRQLRLLFDDATEVLTPMSPFVHEPEACYNVAGMLCGQGVKHGVMIVRGNNGNVKKVVR